MSEPELEVLRSISVALNRVAQALEDRDRPAGNGDAARLLAAIYARAGDRTFVAAELCEHAALPGAEALAAAIIKAVGSLNPRKVGRALRAVEGEPLGGLVVRRIGDDRLGLVWSVQRVSGGETRYRFA